MGWRRLSTRFEGRADSAASAHLRGGGRVGCATLRPTVSPELARRKSAAVHPRTVRRTLCPERRGRVSIHEIVMACACGYNDSTSSEGAVYDRHSCYFGN